MPDIPSSPTISGQARRDLIAQAIDALTGWHEGSEPVVLQAAEITCHLLGAFDAGSYRLDRASEGNGWELESQTFHRGLSSMGTVGPSTRTMLRQDPAKVIPYDPGCPDPAQRNRFVRPMSIYAASYRKLAFARYAGTQNDQLRALVCEGPHFLAWFGAFRPEPFTRQDRSLMNQLIPSLCQRLALERRLEHASLTESTLAVALERIAGAAFVVNQHARVLFANRTGRALADENRNAWQAHIGEGIGRARLGLASPELSVTPVLFRGAARCFLVVFTGHSDESAQRLAMRTTEWGFTPQQSRVVSLMARGDSNKAIAQALECSVRTVEHHVSAAILKAGVETRSELVARFWSRR